MSADLAARPTCACGTRKIRVEANGLFVCPHCDLPCPKVRGGCRLCAKAMVIRD